MTSRWRNEIIIYVQNVLFNVLYSPFTRTLFWIENVDMWNVQNVLRAAKWLDIAHLRGVNLQQ